MVKIDNSRQNPYANYKIICINKDPLFIQNFFYFPFGTTFFVLFTMKGCFSKSLHLGRRVGSFWTSC